MASNEGTTKAPDMASKNRMCLLVTHCRHSPIDHRRSTYMSRKAKSPTFTTRRACMEPRTTVGPVSCHVMMEAHKTDSMMTEAVMSRRLGWPTESRINASAIAIDRRSAYPPAATGYHLFNQEAECGL